MLECLPDFRSHAYLPDAGLRFRVSNVFTDRTIALQLVVDIDDAGLQVNVMFRKSAELGDTQSSAQEYHNLIIILAIYTVCLKKFKQTFFLFRGQRRLGLRIVHNNIGQPEIKGILTDAII